MPVWFQILSGTVTLVLAILTTTFIYKQHKLEKSNFKIEAYDRRIKIYDAIKMFISEIQTIGTTDDEKLTRLLQQTRQAIFLFEDDQIPQYIKLLYQKGVDLEFIKNKLHNHMVSLSDLERMNLANRARELSEWFSAQHKVVEQKFDKYMRLS